MFQSFTVKPTSTPTTLLPYINACRRDKHKGFPTTTYHLPPQRVPGDDVSGKPHFFDIEKAAVAGLFMVMVVSQPSSAKPNGKGLSTYFGKKTTTFLTSSAHLLSMGRHCTVAPHQQLLPPQVCWDSSSNAISPCDKRFFARKHRLVSAEQILSCLLSFSLPVRTTCGDKLTTYYDGLDNWLELLQFQTSFSSASSTPIALSSSCFPFRPTRISSRLLVFLVISKP